MNSPTGLLSPAEPAIQNIPTRTGEVHQFRETFLPVKMKPIPISAAEHIAKTYGYDQVVIYARKVSEITGDPTYEEGAVAIGGEHMTTYGVNAKHCSIAARRGDVLKGFMGWKV